MTRLFKNHGKTVGFWEIEVTDEAYLKISHAKTLDGKVITKLTPVKGKNIGRANETSPLEQAEKELQSRVNKQLDRGYVMTLEEADKPASNLLGQLKPTLAVVYEKFNHEKLYWITAFIQRKFDGHRCMYSDGIIYSRGGKEINLPHIVEEIKRLGLEHYKLDGELYIHGVSLQKIGSLIKRPQEESLQIEYHVYDVVDQENQFVERFVTGLNIPDSSIIQKVGTMGVGSNEEALKVSREFVAEGYEGAIVRWGTQGYEPDKRSNKILKLKGYSEGEFEVIDWKEGLPNGDLRVPVYLCKNHFGGEDFWVTAPGSWVEMDEQFNNIGKYIGKTLTVRYFNLSDDNVPMQGTAKGWREDL